MGTLSAFELHVMEHVMSPDDVLSLGAAHRVLYVVDGELTVTAGSATTLRANEAWQGSMTCRLAVSAKGARVWRWELVEPPARAASPGILKLSHEVRLDRHRGYLMRCDRVDFPPGGVAYTHTHQGPGIRVLLRGGFRVVAGGHTTLIQPGEAWFESGPEPVFAAASESEETGFVRVMILPVELRGKSSIRYVEPEDEGRPRVQRYTVFVDAPISL
jgi:quercetin dioxygenase-like cupin family protein